MNDAQLAMWLGLMLAVSSVFIVIAFVFVFVRQNESMHILQKIGFASLVFGLVVQCLRTLHFFEHGFYPIDRYFPLWITKDIGICVLIYYYSFIHPKRNQNADSSD